MSLIQGLQFMVVEQLEEGIYQVRVNRPEVRNAMNAQCWEELSQAFAFLAARSDVRVVVLTGADKSFISGADISTFSQRRPEDCFQSLGQRVANELANFPFPVIAMVNGFALGGGCEVAMACDLRVASDKSKWGQPEVKLGILAGAGGTQRLPRLVGEGIAKELLYTGRVIEPQEAWRIGLVNRVVPHDQLLAATLELAREIRAVAPVAVRMTKLAVNAGLQADINTGLAVERQAAAFCFTTEDRMEGPAAFLAKRQPQWKGK